MIGIEGAVESAFRSYNGLFHQRQEVRDPILE